MSITTGDGYAIGHLSDLGEGPGMRKVRAPLGVTAFGVNAIVLPPGYETDPHAHERQQEVYFVHRGAIEIRFGDGTRHRLEEGGLARVDPSTVRALRNVGDGEFGVLLRRRRRRLRRPRRRVRVVRARVVVHVRLQRAPERVRPRRLDVFARVHADVT